MVERKPYKLEVPGSIPGITRTGPSQARGGPLKIRAGKIVLDRVAVKVYDLDVGMATALLRAGYNQTADGDAHNVSDVGSIPTPATTPTPGKRPDQRSLQALTHRIA
jgi:hypothetical protein